MKKLLVLFSMLFLTLSAHGAQNALNADGTVKTRHQKFILVQATSSISTLSDGEAVCFDTDADDGITVNYCSIQGDPAACVIADGQSCTSNQMCKCQTYGYHPSVLFDNNASDVGAGEVFYADGEGYGRVAGISSPSATSTILGVALDAVSTSTSFEAFLKLSGGE